MKKILSIIFALIILGVLVWYGKFNRPEIISADTVVKGDYSIEKGKKVAIGSGATLTVEGNLNLSGELACQSGSVVKLIVLGSATVEGDIKCEGQNSGISLVVSKDLNFGSKSELVSDGNIQVVESADLLAVTPEQVQKLYEEAGKDSGTGQRFGPFISKDEASALNTNQSQAAVLTKIQPGRSVALAKLLGIAKAQATSHTVVIGGKITIPTPPAGVKRIVVFNFPTAIGMELKNFELSGPDGRSGADDKGNSCVAKGKDGEDAFRFLAYAGNLTVNNFTLRLGSGGQGGGAETTKDCDPGVATGGTGGKSGNFKMIAGNEFKITGAFVIEPGKGGAGGNAIAHGRDGDPSQKGGDATATGGKGADNKKHLGIAGTVAGTDNVRIGSVTGGSGGNGTANPGQGGDGIGCNSKGGPGGQGTATGGQGGKASLSLAGSAGRTPGAKDIGSAGGNADSYGGQGGAGGDCGPAGPGGPGGNGGDATSKPGNGGTGTTGNGADGANKNETGGDGGNGGDGCPEGPGGKGGKGNPPGDDGQPGKNLCVPVTEHPPSATVTPPTPTPSPTQPKQKIQVIRYQGKYLPVNQLIIEDEAGCGQEHWHAAEGAVQATDGTIVPDPGPQCGYGPVSQNPVIDIEAP